eukprot:SAG31_NODE_10054_length_1190_cov_1.765353_2_plen_53_part_00
MFVSEYANNTSCIVREQVNGESCNGKEDIIRSISNAKGDGPVVFVFDREKPE